MVSEDLRGLDEDYQEKCTEIQKLREDVVRLQTMHQEQRDRLQEKHTEVGNMPGFREHWTLVRIIGVYTRIYFSREFVGTELFHDSQSSFR